MGFRIGGRPPMPPAAVVLAVLLWPSVATPQVASATFRVGSIEVTLTDPQPTEIGIKRGRQEWHVDLSKLVRSNDCAMPYLASERICEWSPTAPCPACPRRISLVTWDEHRQKLYFALSTDFSWEKPFTIFNYNLATRRTSRFINTLTGGFGIGAVSTTGQYLV
jgi:hypothetical protein